MVNLFRCADVALQPVVLDDDPTAIRTPLGTVRLEAMLGTLSVTSRWPAATYRLAKGGWIARWEHDIVDAELLVCRIPDPVPLELDCGTVEECWAGLWRVRAKESGHPCLLTVAWDDDYIWQTCGPESGQGLHGWVWEDERTWVAIGTQDDEALAYRAQNRDGVPREWRPRLRSEETDLILGNGPDASIVPVHFWLHPIHEALRDRGLAIPLPRLDAGSLCEVYFAVAWVPKDARPDDYSTAAGLAIEPGIQRILESAGCS